MTKNERKGLLIGIGLFSFFISSYIKDLIKEPVYAFFIAFMLFALITTFILGTIQPKQRYEKHRSVFPLTTKYEHDPKAARIKKVKKQKIEALRSMDPYQFEEYVKDLLLSTGFKTAKCTPRSNDGGKDIIATDSEGKKVFVECKRHEESNKIGRPLIQKFHSALIDGNADYGLFVTTSYFNENAVKYARNKDIRLIDARLLADMIEQVANKKGTH